ncbi:MAG: flagellar basal body-associated FliL family protein [Acidobacteria bacterium]|nr:flagellar basal body-associated FliL family protein [Acidobacteriota bacterium]
MAQDTQTKARADAKQKIESKPIVENKADAEYPKKSSKLWILMGSIALIIVIGGVGFLAYPRFMAARNSGLKPGHTSKLEQVKATFPLEPFLVNLADTDASRFVKTTFQLGLAEEMEEKDDSVSIPAMRDSIITLLSSKTAEQILTTAGKDKLREEVRSRVNALSPKMKVVEVYIVDFVVQL